MTDTALPDRTRWQTSVIFSAMGRTISITVMLLGLAMVGFHMAIATGWVRLPSIIIQCLHLAFIWALVFLPSAAASRGPAEFLLAVAFMAMGLAGTGYVIVNLEELEFSMGFPSTTAIVIGFMLMASSVEGVRRAWGWALPIVSLVFILYFFFGHHIAGILAHRHFDVGFVVSYLSVGLSGMFGPFLSISANEVFLFIVFGTLFPLLGINDLLTEIGKLIGRRVSSGPGQMATVSSGMVGMITGASVANVVISGSFTIPFMKRAGYSPSLAGAVEATASTGGQMMPPVMGAAAFLIAFFIGVPYTDVMLAGILPALLFYVAIVASVHFASVSEGVEARTDAADMALILRLLPNFVIPVGLITGLLLIRQPPDTAALAAIVAALVLALMRRDRPSLPEIARQLASGAVIGARLGITLTVIGMISQTLITTGLGSKLASLIELYSFGNLFIALIITMLVSIIFGMGVPPAAAYSLIAITALPAVVKMGAPLMAAHFFAFYFAIVSALTPPVALGALAASAIAGGNYFATSIKAFRLAISGFIIPFFFVYSPILILRPESLEDSIGSLISLPVMLVGLSALMFGHGLRRLTTIEKLWLVGSLLLLLAYHMTRAELGTVPAFAILAVGLLSAGLLARHHFRTAKPERP
ncbi:MAG: TRAP transporter fused permease subunit [Rhizobiaceae bacterium]|nr:TRAP transporter fused permease subunit [Rhizobiaceae bacterium]MCV0407232.1 TRAP transporter fused permease subunit [Rhizobiaceae bacterium]